jgi:hypothetical protein
MLRYPELFRVRQTFDRPKIEDVAQAIVAEFDKLKLSNTIKPNQTVAITAGSRGITNFKLILKTIVDYVKSLGAVPVIIPAMGSHGGATATGQLEILASYDITPATLGCEFRSNMETVVVCDASQGFPIHFDKEAFGCDHVIVCNRVKPHTELAGDIQSGLIKMLVIGLGKHAGAKILHRAIRDHDFSDIVRSVVDPIVKECRIVAGLAVIENGYDETGFIRGVAPNEFMEREVELLKIAKTNLPKLPFDVVDVLIVDEIGKNISGTGLDTNIVGRKFTDHVAAKDEWPKVRRIIVRSLTEETHGNANGIGIAEFCKASAARQIDKRVTWINSLTSAHMSGAMEPIHFETDREILDACLPTIGLTEPQDAKLLWIKNTLHLEEVECGAAFWKAAQSRKDLEILTEVRPMPLDQDGNLPTFQMGH